MMASNFICLLLLLILASVFKITSSIVLCDEGCNNAPEGFGICEKATGKIPLSLMGFFPCNTEGFRARGLTVAGQMAARAVRLNSSILQDYRLEIAFSNSMCQRIAGVRAFIDRLRESSTLDTIHHMIIGPGCSTGAITIAETAPFYSLTQISYTATTITLSDTRRFPTFLRTISSDNASIAMVGAVVRQFQWEQIAIISLRNEVFINLTAVMIESYTEQGVRVISERLFFDAESQFQVFEDLMEEVKMSGARIVLLNVFENYGRQLLCAAYRKGMLYPTYLYITHYWWSQGWFLDSGSNCTVDEIVKATNHTIAVDHFPEPLADEMDSPTDVGLTPNEFWKYFDSKLTALAYPPNEALRQAGYVYDAVWAAALALDSVDRQLKAGVLGEGRSLRDFTYNASDINQLIFNSTKSRTFSGVTGQVTFNEFGDREPTGEIYQYLFPTELNFSNESLPNFEPFARVNRLKNRLIFIDGQSEETVFPEGVPQAAEPLVISLALFVIMTTLSIAGIIFAVVCIVFNLAFRAKRVVKLTSPYLNVVTVIGAIFFYMVVILFGIDENIASFDTVDRLCQARIWVASIGFSLFFGPMLAKAFRVYYIFRSVKLKKKPIKDWILLLTVAVLVAIDIVFLVIVTVDIWRLTLTSTLLDREGGQIPLIVDTCESTASQIWLPILLGYKAIYLLVGLLLASQTYNVKIKALRDSKLIVVSVFAIFVISVVLAVVGFVVDDDPNALYGLLAGFILTLITGVMALLFVPRMVELWRNPSGEVTLNTVPNSTPSNHTNSLTPDEKAQIAALRSNIASLKEEIDKVKSSKEFKESMKENGVEVIELQQEVKRTATPPAIVEEAEKDTPGIASSGMRERRKGAEQT